MRMKNWQKRCPPYMGDEPYLYFAFAGQDREKAWRVLRPLLERGCRVWYCCGPAGDAGELRRRQERASGAGLTLLYLSDAACADRELKSYILVNQKFGRPILSLDPDGTDRRLSMGLYESVPHLPLYQLTREGELESAVLHAEGFSQTMLDAPVVIRGGGTVKKLSVTLLALGSDPVGTACWRPGICIWFQPKPPELSDELSFSDPVILAAVRETAQGGPITCELAEQITCLELDSLPENWDDLSLLPALQRIRLPQQALLSDGALPEEGYTVELIGGGT